MAKQEVDTLKTALEKMARRPVGFKEHHGTSGMSAPASHYGGYVKAARGESVYDLFGQGSGRKKQNVSKSDKPGHPPTPLLTHRRITRLSPTNCVFRTNYNNI